MAIFLMNNPSADNWYDRMVYNYMVDSYLDNLQPQSTDASASFVPPFNRVHRPSSSNVFCSRQRPSRCSTVKPNIRQSADKCSPNILEDLLKAFFQPQPATASDRPAAANVNNNNTDKCNPNIFEDLLNAFFQPEPAIANGRQAAEQTTAANVNGDDKVTLEVNNNADNQQQAPSSVDQSATVVATATAEPKKIEIDLQEFKPENVLVKVVNNRLLVEATQEQIENGINSKLELKRQFELGEHYDVNSIQCLYTTQGKLMIEIPRVKAKKSIVLPIHKETVEPQLPADDQVSKSTKQTIIEADASNTSEQTNEINDGSAKMDLALD